MKNRRTLAALAFAVAAAELAGFGEAVDGRWTGGGRAAGKRRVNGAANECLRSGRRGGLRTSRVFECHWLSLSRCSTWNIKCTPSAYP